MSSNDFDAKPSVVDQEIPGVRFVRMQMPLRNLPDEFVGASLVQISDLHCGPRVSQKRLERLVAAVNSLDPDFVAITGDFVTFASRRDARLAARICGDLKARRAVLACLGNHDYGVWHPNGLGGNSAFRDYLIGQLAERRVIVLRNSCQAVFRGESVLQFVGVDDYWTRHYSPQEAFSLADPDTPTIALVHNPDAAIELAAWSPEWVLSGHTHGQPTPDTRFWNMVYPTRHKQFVGGQYRIGSATTLYVSRGIGGSFFNQSQQRPEITVFKLQRVDQKPAQRKHPTEPIHSDGLVV